MAFACASAFYLHAWAWGCRLGFCLPGASSRLGIRTIFRSQSAICSPVRKKVSCARPRLPCASRRRADKQISERKPAFARMAKNKVSRWAALLAAKGLNVGGWRRWPMSRGWYMRWP